MRIIVACLLVLAGAASGGTDLDAEVADVRAHPYDLKRVEGRQERLLELYAGLAARAAELPPEWGWLIDLHRRHGASLRTYVKRLAERGAAGETLVAVDLQYQVAVQLAAQVARGEALHKVKLPVPPPPTTGRSTRESNLIARLCAIATMTMVHEFRSTAVRALLADPTMKDALPSCTPALVAQVDQDLERLRAPPPSHQETQKSHDLPKGLSGVVVAALCALGTVAVRRRRASAPAVAPAVPAVSPPSPDPGNEPTAVSGLEGMISLDQLATHLPARYRDARKLGAGTMGVVFRAQDTLAGRPVAIKMLSPALTGDTAARKRFLVEARSLAALSHPNILTLYDVNDTPWPYFSMSLLEGEDLKRRLERGPLAAPEVATLAAALLDALAHAHAAGIVHRDIKPANIFLRADGVALLVDFGLSRHLESTHITKVGHVVGTLLYMAPEQLLGKEVGPTADLYAITEVVHVALTGRLPFDERDATSKLSGAVVRPEVGRWVAPVLERALALDPARRYPDARALGAALAEAFAGPARVTARDAAALAALEDLRAASLHALTARLAVAAVLEGEPVRFGQAFLDPKNLADVLALVQGLSARIAAVGPALAASADPALAAVSALLADEGRVAAKLETYVRWFVDTRPPQPADRDVSDLQGRIAGLARRYRELNQDLRTRTQGYRVDLAELLEARAEPLAARGMRLSVEAGADTVRLVPEAQALRDDVATAFDVLLENAYQAGGRALVARWGEVGGALVLTLVDDGQGLPEGDPERLFAEGVTTRAGGTGTGLRLARARLARHGTALALERGAPRGACALVTFPAVPRLEGAA